MRATRYFVINKLTDTMHIQGYCFQSKPRMRPIRLFDTGAELEAYAGRPLRLCKMCARKLETAEKTVRRSKK